MQNTNSIAIKLNRHRIKKMIFIYLLTWKVYFECGKIDRKFERKKQESNSQCVNNYEKENIRVRERCSREYPEKAIDSSSKLRWDATSFSPPQRRCEAATSTVRIQAPARFWMQMIGEAEKKWWWWLVWGWMRCECLILWRIWLMKLTMLFERFCCMRKPLMMRWDWIGRMRENSTK